MAELASDEMAEEGMMDLADAADTLEAAADVEVAGDALAEQAASDLTRSGASTTSSRASIYWPNPMTSPCRAPWWHPWPRITWS